MKRTFSIALVLAIGSTAFAGKEGGGFIRETASFRTQLGQLQHAVHGADWTKADKLIQSLSKEQGLKDILSSMQQKSRAGNDREPGFDSMPGNDHGVLIQTKEKGVAYRVYGSLTSNNIKSVTKNTARLAKKGWSEDAAYRWSWMTRMFHPYDSQAGMEISRREDGRPVAGTWVTLGSQYGKGVDHIAIYSTARPAIDKWASDFTPRWFDAKGALMLEAGSYKVLPNPTGNKAEGYRAALHLFEHLADISAAQ